LLRAGHASSRDAELKLKRGWAAASLAEEPALDPRGASTAQRAKRRSARVSALTKESPFLLDKWAVLERIPFPWRSYCIVACWCPWRSLEGAAR